MEKISLPNGWEMKKLGEVCSFQGGSQPPKSQFIYEKRDSYVRFLQIRDFKSDKNITYIPESPKNRYCSDDDILLGRYGASVGKVLINKTGAYNVAVMKTIPDEKVLFKRYLFFYFTSNDFQNRLEIVSSRSAQNGFSKNDIFDFPILVPPLHQQKQIVGTLDKAFAAIDTAKANAEQNLQNAKELFENTLQILFDNKNWENKKLGEIASFKNGMNFTKSSKGQSIEIVGVKNFKNKFWVPFEELEKVILDGEMSEAYQLKKGDIITVRSNGNPKLIGRTLLANKVNGNVSHSGFTIRIRLNSNTLLPVFLCHYLKTSKTRKELVDSGNGVGIKSLNQGSLSSLMIPYPKSEEEQKLIVNKIEGISKQTKKLEAIYTQKIADLEEMKKSVLQKAFSGQFNTIN
ncbi:MAG: restriction endonuclease subunit S [Polaribacter sp.]